MQIRTDDDVYRVDAVWLGPPKATFPWRARYVSWGVGMVTFLVVIGVERQLGIGFSDFCFQAKHGISQLCSLGI